MQILKCFGPVVNSNTWRRKLKDIFTTCHKENNSNHFCQHDSFIIIFTFFKPYFYHFNKSFNLMYDTRIRKRLNIDQWHESLSNKIIDSGRAPSTIFDCSSHSRQCSWCKNGCRVVYTLLFIQVSIPIQRRLYQWLVAIHLITLNIYIQYITSRPIINTLINNYLISNIKI